MMITKIKAFFVPNKYMGFIKSYLMLKTIKRCPGYSWTFIKDITFLEHFTELEGRIVFWYNDKNNSTQVVDFKSFKWYIFLLKSNLKIKVNIF